MLFTDGYCFFYILLLYLCVTFCSVTFFFPRFIKGISLAMCCHHRCDWKSYVGKKFLEENDMSVHQFNIMRSMTSWAVCGNTTVEGENG